MRPVKGWWLTIVWLGVCLATHSTQGQGPDQQDAADGKPEQVRDEDLPLVLPPKTRPVAKPSTLDDWVKQLGHDQPLRRETATRNLVAAGPKAIPALVQALRSGDLETVERSVSVMREIALARPPDDDGGAWKELNQLATRASGIRAASAKTALDEVRDHRGNEAKTALLAAGIFVGVDDFLVRAISQPRTLVEIGDQWRGDVEPLQWLRWLEGIEFARVKGKSVKREVLQQLVKVPDLHTITIVNAEVDQRTLEPLKTMARINSLEFRYVKLNEQLADQIAEMPVRLSLNFMGTTLPLEKVEAMREALPGLTIDHKQGGFLGVTCLDTLDACQISGVVAGGAAEAAGLIPGDVIVEISGAPVGRFRDLQNAINQHLPGDEVEVKFRRGDKIEALKLRLRKLDDQ